MDNNPPSRTPVQETKISIVGVEFQEDRPLSGAVREELAKDIQQPARWLTHDEPDTTWVDEALFPITETLRNQGYFKASVEGTPYLVRALPAERRYVLKVTVDSGPKFKLGQIRFASASGTPLVFPEALLRQQFHMQEGEVFDLSKIRDGLEGIGRLYGSKGYIDATPEPDTTVDEEALRIDLLIKVDEERPYRITNIEFLGLESTSQKYLSVPQETGDVFDPILWVNFFRDNRSHLPAAASSDKNMRIRRNVKDGTVEIALDFRPCPAGQPLHEELTPSLRRAPRT
jgi:outer membrane protein insertion porin family